MTTLTPTPHQESPVSSRTHTTTTAADPLNAAPPSPVFYSDHHLNRILTALLASDRPAPDLLAELGTDLLTFARWLRQPESRDLLAALTELAEFRARIIAAHSLPAAAEALARISSSPIESPKHAETIRKASAAIIKLAQPAAGRNSRSPRDPERLPSDGPERESTAEGREESRRNTPADQVGTPVRPGCPGGPLPHNENSTPCTRLLGGTPWCNRRWEVSSPTRTRARRT